MICANDEEKSIDIVPGGAVGACSGDCAGIPWESAKNQ